MNDIFFQIDKKLAIIPPLETHVTQRFLRANHGSETIRIFTKAFFIKISFTSIRKILPAILNIKIKKINCLIIGNIACHTSNLKVLSY